MVGLSALHVLCLAAGLTAASAVPSAASIGPRVRAATAPVQALLAAGARRSSTFARLLRELDATDLVVYVEETLRLPLGLDGRLTFLTTAGGIRYVRVQIPEGVGVFAAISTIGHELQHALEIAAHPQVRDSAGLAALYRQIGVQGTSEDRYDTAEARVIGRRVRAEL